MRQNQNQMWALVLALVVLFAGTSPAVRAADDEKSEVHIKKVHKVVVDCEAGSDEECQPTIHIKTLGDDDHEMTWIENGAHGTHYSFGSVFAGKGGFLGVQLTDLTPELRTHFGVPSDEGVMVAKVIDDSAAFRAGLAAGDIITRVAGETIGSSDDLTRAIRSREEGEVVDLDIWRDGLSETISATLDKNEQLAGMHRRHVMIDCDDSEEDCGAHFALQTHHGMAVDCPDGEECDIKINCDEGACDCTVNGNSIDCEALHGRHEKDD